MRTSVFLSFRANVRPPSQWIPTNATSSPTSSYSTPLSALMPLSLFLESRLIAPFPFSKHVSSLKAKFFRRLQAFCVISAFFWDPSREFLFRSKLFFDPFSLMLYPYSFLSKTLPTLPIWNVYTEQQVALSPTASRPPPSLFSFLRRFYLPYESL